MTPRPGRRRIFFAALCFASARAFTPRPRLPVRNVHKTELGFTFFGEATVEGFASAFLGGTVGTIGSVIAIEAKRVKTKKSKECPYCRGTGSIECATCLGTGLLASGEKCENCEGRRVHTCENCKGRGRFIPMMLDARISRDPESELEEVGLQ
mmetsp:Transcript_1251/g.3768  ORF Transcript_1251/g.3768 Transcript_1251/m.3768 type:complete len:153 (+) Transcript_1251:291-749(+)